jgi:hypothetical protein
MIVKVTMTKFFLKKLTSKKIAHNLHGRQIKANDDNIQAC